MTLHQAIQDVLRHENKSMSTSEIAEKINRLKLYTKGDNSNITSSQVGARINKKPDIFQRIDGLVSLKINRSVINKETKTESDENYILNLCDNVLGLQSRRQYQFDFLLGDPNQKGVCRKLPVDAYYPELNLVIEYKERQHSEAVSFFDKPEKITISGKPRREQRKDYDERRRVVLPQYGIKLLELSYNDFLYNSRKRLIRNYNDDIARIKILLDNIKNN